MTKRGLLPFLALPAAMPVAAMAQDGRTDFADSGDTAWMIAAACLVLFAGLGLALHNSGSVRARNGLSVLIQTAAVSAVVTLLWGLVGYTLAFGDITGGWIGGGNAWMLIELGNLRGGTRTAESAFALFQIAVAALGPALMIGAWAERARFGWVVTFSALWTLVVQAPIAHWIWGGGWLSRNLGVLDWAGGLVTFTSAGVSALVVALLMGRRLGFPGQSGRPQNPALALSGSAIVWIGALGLCGGWAVAANDDAAAAMIAAHLAIAAAALTWAGLERLSIGRVTAIGLGKGVIAGMAVSAPAAGYISPGAAMLFGVLGALTGFPTRRLIREALNVDDTLDVFAVSGACGILGSLLLGLFLSPSLGGIGYFGDMSMKTQLIAQLYALAIVIFWSGMATAIVALMASLLFPMRVSEDAELAGLDLASHGHGGEPLP
ncbi:ammonium transporter [Novosphingobium sp.]|jgi:Amt family ammonium transporter|uniref:ammonium transporter n=1 Tax=Novosphingobium sp. TaxID=1874826 RepID=UPI003D6D4284